MSHQELVFLANFKELRKPLYPGIPGFQPLKLGKHPRFCKSLGSCVNSVDLEAWSQQLHSNLDANLPKTARNKGGKDGFSFFFWCPFFKRLASIKLTYPTKREKENHRLKTCLRGYVIVLRRVLQNGAFCSWILFLHQKKSHEDNKNRDHQAGDEKKTRKFFFLLETSPWHWRQKKAARHHFFQGRGPLRLVKNRSQVIFLANQDNPCHPKKHHPFCLFSQTKISIDF